MSVILAAWWLDLAQSVLDYMAHDAPCLDGEASLREGKLARNG